MLRPAIPLVLAAALGAGLAFAAAPFGVGDSAAWVFADRTLAAALAEVLARSVGDAAALRALAVGGAALSAAVLLATLRAVSPGQPLRTAGITLAALLSAPVLTGAQSAVPGAACLGPAALALASWSSRPALAAVLTAAVGLWSPAAGATLALGGALLTRTLPPLVLAALLAAIGGAGVEDVTAASSLAWVREPAVPTAGLALLAAAVLLPGSAAPRAVAALAAVLALGPVLSVQGRLVPLPAAALAALGTSGGWSAAGVVAAAALALVAADPPAMARGLAARQLVAAALIAGDGLALGSRPVVPFPVRVPEVVRSLAERTGGVLVLPPGRLGERPARRAALWRHLAERFHRPLYAGGETLASSDPALGATGVMALFAVLEPEQNWVLPPADDGKVLRALGVTELVLDRSACSASELASIDPVMARLFGAPQRDIEAGVDLWRIAAEGDRSFPKPPYLRREGEAGTHGWQGIEKLLAAPGASAGPAPTGPG